MKNKEKRLSILINVAIVTLVLLSMKFLNDLFGPQISDLKTAVSSIVFPLVVALFISYLLAPLVRVLEKRAKIPKRWMSVIIVYIIVFVFGVVFTYFIGDLIYSQAIIFIDKDWDKIVVYVKDFVENNESFAELADYASSFLNVATVSPMIINVFSIFKSITAIVLTVVLVPVFLFFIMTDKEKIFAGFLVVVPKKYKGHVTELGKRSNLVIEQYFNGRFLTMFIMSIFFTTVFFILGFGQRSIFFGFTLGFLDIIPYVGGFVGMLLPLLYSLTISDGLLFDKWTWLVVVIVNTFGQLVQGNILQPIIMGKEVNLHPLLVLSSFVFFGSLLGVTGIILAIPLTGIIKATFEYFDEINQEKKIPKKSS